MTTCERLSDRMPEVAQGRARWTVEESVHLAACAECRAEWDLVAATIRLGSKAPQVGPPDAIATVVLRRVTEDRRSRGRRRLWGLGVAAAAALGGVIWTGDRPEPGASPVATIENTTPDTEPLENGELDSMFEALDASQLGASALEVPSLDDLDTNELEQVLRTLEG
jgi:predicted anti-sigma-YlaC factor YlaD